MDRLGENFVPMILTGVDMMSSMGKRITGSQCVTSDKANHKVSGVI